MWVDEAGGSMDRASGGSAGEGSGWWVSSGEDARSRCMCWRGGGGAICTRGAVAPKQMCDLYRAFAGGDVETARKLHFDLFDLFGALFAEANPQPAKYALHRLGISANELRLPMVPAASQTEELVDHALAKLGLISASN